MHVMYLCFDLVRGSITAYETQYDNHVIRAGVNFHNSETNMLSVMSVGPTPINIRQTPVVILSMGFVSEDINDFFDEDQLLYNIASLLGLSPGQIRIVKVKYISGLECTGF